MKTPTMKIKHHRTRVKPIEFDPLLLPQTRRVLVLLGARKKTANRYEYTDRGRLSRLLSANTMKKPVVTVDKANGDLWSTMVASPAKPVKTTLTLRKAVCSIGITFCSVVTYQKDGTLVLSL
jgi:hypothetical protein